MAAWVDLQGSRRRLIQAVFYEAVAVAVVAPSLAWLFAHPPASALLLSIVLSGIAFVWNLVYNAGFERWEAGRGTKGRSWRLRLLHGLGFETGLALMLVPVMALWLGVTLWQALVADLGLIVFFFFYTVVFTWCFDRLFGLPASAR
jgi:uncharacterized membrane protein